MFRTHQKVQPHNALPNDPRNIRPPGATRTSATATTPREQWRSVLAAVAIDDHGPICRGRLTIKNVMMFRIRRAGLSIVVKSDDP